MTSINMIMFCKTASCPTSEELLAFQAGDSSFAKSEVIVAHLSVCEFCIAEVEFYGNCPQSNEKIPKVEIPGHLFELAQVLLGNPKRDVLEILFSDDKVAT